MPTAATVANVAVTTQLDESAPTQSFHNWLGAKVNETKIDVKLYMIFDDATVGN